MRAEDEEKKWKSRKKIKADVQPSQSHQFFDSNGVPIFNKEKEVKGSLQCQAWEFHTDNYRKLRKRARFPSFLPFPIFFAMK